MIRRAQQLVQLLLVACFSLTVVSLCFPVVEYRSDVEPHTAVEVGFFQVCQRYTAEQGAEHSNCSPYKPSIDCLYRAESLFGTLIPTRDPSLSCSLFNTATAFSILLALISCVSCSCTVLLCGVQLVSEDPQALLFYESYNKALSLLVLISIPIFVCLSLLFQTVGSIEYSSATWTTGFASAIAAAACVAVGLAVVAFVRHCVYVELEETVRRPSESVLAGEEPLLLNV